MPATRFDPIVLITWLKALQPTEQFGPELESRIAQLQANIGLLQGNELAGVAFYLSKLGYWRKDLWDYIDMRVSRSEAADSMSVPAIIRLLEVFAGRETDQLVRQEALTRLETALYPALQGHLQAWNGKSLISTLDYSRCVWTLGTCRTGSLALYEALEALYMREIRLNTDHRVEDYSKVMWTFVYSGYETSRLSTHIAVQAVPLLQPACPWSNRLLWAVNSSRFSLSHILSKEPSPLRLYPLLHFPELLRSPVKALIQPLISPQSLLPFPPTI